MLVSPHCKTLQQVDTRHRADANVEEQTDLDLDLLTSGSVHADVLPWAIDLLNLVSIALAAF